MPIPLPIVVGVTFFVVVTVEMAGVEALTGGRVVVGLGVVEGTEG